MISFFKKVYTHKLAAVIFSLTGFVVYTVKSIYYAMHLPSILDEGLFLLKGIYYTNGAYIPYQEYGFWMNKMPFGYLFSGWLQQVFGPGLGTGRTAAVVFGVGSLIAIWLLIQRLTNRPWLAGIAIWLFALNNSIIQIYSQFFSEVMVAFFMAWMLYFLLGKERKTWQLLCGGFLLGLVLITRQNLVPLFGFVPLYVFIENRKLKPALISFAPAAVLFIFVHILYWPNIIQMWVPWFPSSITPFLDPYRVVLPGVPVYNPEIPLLTRLHAMWEGIRIHFIPLTLSIVSLILLTERRTKEKSLKKHPHFILFLFLPLTYLFLVAEHFYATIMLDYCVYCFTMYLSFFTVFGILSIITVPDLLKVKSTATIFSLSLTSLFLVIWPAGVLFGAWRLVS